ncbi:MAG: alpha/beta hydrolase [Leptospiraceae bacterium]|nr:hypothetical protein [Leptospiraceae bacterium]MCP5500673.1 alpha/beta hydrolase [Leptospiraceae bacterium]
MTQTKKIYFAHGKESGPQGRKILRLSEVAKKMGFETESPSYEGMNEPEERIKKLLNLYEPRDTIILVGSSMGAYVSTVASRHIKPDGLFLLAPAFYIDSYPEKIPEPEARQIEIVHGWKDDLISPKNIFHYAEQFGIKLHMLDSNHRLSDCVEDIAEIFKNFLKKF